MHPHAHYQAKWRTLFLQEERLLYHEAQNPPEAQVESTDSPSQAHESPEVKAEQRIKKADNDVSHQRNRVENAPKNVLTVSGAPEIKRETEEKKENPPTEKDIENIHTLKKESLLKSMQDLSDDPNDKKELEKAFLAMNGYSIEGSDEPNLKNVKRVEGFAVIMQAFVFAVLSLRLFQKKFGNLLKRETPSSPSSPEEQRTNLQNVINARIAAAKVLEPVTIALASDGTSSFNIKFKSTSEGKIAQQKFIAQFKEKSSDGKTAGASLTETGVKFENIDQKTAQNILSMIEAAQNTPAVVTAKQKSADATAPAVRDLENSFKNFLREKSPLKSTMRTVRNAIFIQQESGERYTVTVDTGMVEKKSTAATINVLNELFPNKDITAKRIATNPMTLQELDTFRGILLRRLG